MYIVSFIFLYIKSFLFSLLHFLWQCSSHPQSLITIHKHWLQYTSIDYNAQSLSTIHNHWLQYTIIDYNTQALITYTSIDYNTYCLHCELLIRLALQCLNICMHWLLTLLLLEIPLFHELILVTAHMQIVRIVITSCLRCEILQRKEACRYIFIFYVAVWMTVYSCVPSPYYRNNTPPPPPPSPIKTIYPNEH